MHIVSYMANTEICHIIIKGLLQCIMCLWRETVVTSSVVTRSVVTRSVVTRFVVTRSVVTRSVVTRSVVTVQ